MDAHELWQATLGRLQLTLDRPAYDTWVSHTQSISYEDGVLVVGVRSAYAKDWLENRLYAVIQRTATEVAGRTIAVRFIVRRNASADADSAPVEVLDMPQAPPTFPGADDSASTRLNPRYTFANFIVGQSNRLAHAGCLAVAERPGVDYNPLFIYGGVGLGKTHLLHAVGNAVVLSGLRTLYVSAETFANELINAIRLLTTEEFRARYRTIDVLLLDDVQFLIGKERTQEEFFHTFNDLYQDGRQIVLSSDRSPKAFVGLEERLRSRFEWGLTADVQFPDLETRMAILAAKAEALRVTLPPEVIAFIAQEVQSNIRELEGALNRVMALARTMGYSITVQTAQRALGGFLRPAANVTIAGILSQVGAYFDIPVDELVGKRRTRDVAIARQVAMYLARDLTDMSLPQIGEAMGGRDHTTVMHGCNKITALFEKDDGVRRQVLEIKSQLYASGQHTAQIESARSV